MAPNDWLLVQLETPYAGDVEFNVKFARACMRDCLLRGEAPFASHLLYTQEGVLNDLIQDERRLGISAGLAWGGLAQKTVVYTNLGMTPGMRIGIERAQLQGRRVQYRRLEGWQSGAE